MAVLRSSHRYKSRGQGFSDALVVSLVIHSSAHRGELLSTPAARGPSLAMANPLKGHSHGASRNADAKLLTTPDCLC